MIKLCLAKDPNERRSIKDILVSDIIKKNCSKIKQKLEKLEENLEK